MLTTRSIAVLACMTAISLILAVAMAFSAGSDDTLYKQGETYAATYQYIRQNFAGEVSPEELFYGALKGMAEATGDEYTTYLSPEEYQSARTHTSGEFIGVGVFFRTREDGSHLVVAPLRNSPAYAAGIRAGDIIEAVDGRSLAGLKSYQVQEAIKGAEGTPVELTITRHDTGKTVKVTLKRAKVKIESVVSTGFVSEEKKIGYVRVETFSKETADDLLAAIKGLKKKGMKALIIDLRDNGGGLLDQAIKVSDLFLGEGVIVSTKGKAPGSSRVYRAHDKDTALPGNHVPIVILVNRNSASASEIVAGALRDHGRASLIGDNTYGKNSVQTIKPMEGGNSALKITIARYYTPNNTSLEDGLKPDVIVEIPADKWVETARKRVEFELAHDGKPYVSDDDRQLSAAIEHLSDRN